MVKKSDTNEIRCHTIGILKDKTKTNWEKAKFAGISEKSVRTARKNYDPWDLKESTRRGIPRKLIDTWIVYPC